MQLEKEVRELIERNEQMQVDHDLAAKDFLLQKPSESATTQLATMQKENHKLQLTLKDTQTALDFERTLLLES